VTGWHLLSGKEQGESDAKRIVTDAVTPSGRQRTARRFAVGRGRPITATSGAESGPKLAFDVRASNSPRCST
jgi:hypothetical protein